MHIMAGTVVDITGTCDRVSIVQVVVVTMRRGRGRDGGKGG
jgi:hypothetical protein